MAIRFPRRSSRRDHAHAFTLLEVALIVAIIGMMLLIIVGYLLTPKNVDALVGAGIGAGAGAGSNCGSATTAG